MASNAATTSYRIGDLCSFAKGASIPRDRMCETGEWKYIHYGDLYKGFNLYIDIENPAKPIPYVSSSERARIDQFVTSGDIVYVLTSETVDDLGHAFLVRNAGDWKILAGTETTVMRIKRTEAVLPAYLNYLLQTERFKQLLRQYVTGMKVFRVHPRDIEKIEIGLPSLKEQQAVVNIMDAIYEKMLTNTQLNDYLSAMCEAVAGAMDADGTTILADISSQVTAKVACEESTIESYVSTESLLPDKGGRQTASALPATGKVTVYQPGDTLVSNIRPYFKKVWFADREGTCSGDVIVFRAKDPELAPYLYSILRSDGFFEHVMAGAKGTKMPRGDKKQMMQYPVANDCDEDDLEVLASMLDHISANNRESTRLSELRDALLPKLMAGEIDVSGIELSTQPNNHFV